MKLLLFRPNNFGRVFTVLRHVNEMYRNDKLLVYYIIIILILLLHV